MSGISYTATINDADMRAKLEALVEKMANSHGFFKNVGEHLVTSVKDNFEGEHAPDGTPWQRLSNATIGARLRRNGNAPLTILRVSGALSSVNYEAGNDYVRVGSGLVYAAIQHFGGQAGRNRKVNIPARPYLGMSADDETVILEQAEEWLAVE